MITRFYDEYRWLSNFAPVRVRFAGVTYNSVEHAYQAAKSTDETWRMFCATEPKAGKVKRKSRRIEVRADWEEIKVEVMRDLVAQKFSQEPYRSLLLDTGNLYIIEGNTWGDTFWGVDLRSGEGANILGQMIMDIRHSLVAEEVVG